MIQATVVNAASQFVRLGSSTAQMKRGGYFQSADPANPRRRRGRRAVRGIERFLGNRDVAEKEIAPLPHHTRRCGQRCRGAQPVHSLAAALTGHHAEHPLGRFRLGWLGAAGRRRRSGMANCFRLTAGAWLFIQHACGHIHTVLDPPSQFLLSRETAAVFPAIVGVHASAGAMSTSERLAEVFTVRASDWNAKARDDVAREDREYARSARSATSNRPPSAMQFLRQVERQMEHRGDKTRCVAIPTAVLPMRMSGGKA